MKPIQAFLLTVFCIFGASCPILANDILVETNADELLTDQKCSLREAMTNAQSNSSAWPDCEAGSGVDIDVIRFDVGLVDQTIQLSADLPSIGESLRIVGPLNNGPAVTLDGMDAFRLIDIEGASTVELRNLVLTRGSASTGAAINAPETIDLTIRNCRIVNNATTVGPVIAVNVDGDGPALLTMRNTVVRENINSGSGSASNGKILRIDDGTARIERSEITDNSGTGSSGTGIIYARDSHLTVINSTISGNRLSGNAAGSAMYLSASDAELIHATIFDNRSKTLAARPIFVFASSPNSASLVISNSIALPSSGSFMCQASGPGTTSIIEASSFSSDVACLQTSPIVAADDLALAPLDDNGGLSRTHALGLQSIAIDAAGDCAELDSELMVDQRSEIRPGLNSAACDAGAYEAQLPVDSIFADAFEDSSRTGW